MHENLASRLMLRTRLYYRSFKIACTSFRMASYLSLDLQTCYDDFLALETSQVCEHTYCIECLKALFIKAIADESLHSPRCCRQKFDVDLVAHHMSYAELVAYQEVAVEFATLSRVYCSGKTSGNFVPSAWARASVSFKAGSSLHSPLWPDFLQ